MKYNITETVDTVSWSEAISNAPAEIVKAGKEMTERGEIATFAKIEQTDPAKFVWAILTVNKQGQLTVAKRNTEISTNS